MKKIAVVFTIVLLAAIILWAAYAVVKVKGIEGTIVDEKGQSLSGCFIIYDYTVRGEWMGGYQASKSRINN